MAGVQRSDVKVLDEDLFRGDGEDVLGESGWRRRPGLAAALATGDRNSFLKRHPRENAFPRNFLDTPFHAVAMSATIAAYKPFVVRGSDVDLLWPLARKMLTRAIREKILPK